MPTGATADVHTVSLANPHCVVFVSEPSAGNAEPTDDWVLGLGPKLEVAAQFPKRTNVEFVKVLNARELQQRTWERGSGETLACGTGACAAVAVLRGRGELDSRVTVELPGGKLTVEWQGRGHPAWLSGPSRKVFEGTISL